MECWKMLRRIHPRKAPRRTAKVSRMTRSPMGRDLRAQSGTHFPTGDATKDTAAGGGGHGILAGNLTRRLAIFFMALLRAASGSVADKKGLSLKHT